MDTDRQGNLKYDLSVSIFDLSTLKFEHTKVHNLTQNHFLIFKCHHVVEVRIY